MPQEIPKDNGNGHKDQHPGITQGASGEMTVEHVHKGYGLKPLVKVVLGDCNFVLENRKLTVLIGPSGCGKSTLVNILAGYDMPDSGKVTLDGVPVKGPGRDRLVVFQETALFPWMTTYQNVSFGPRVRNELSKEELRVETTRLLKLVGLEAFADKYPSQLSGGMMRRAELVRALINRPKVMLMDEPFRGLDAMTRALMQEYYVRLFETKPGTNLFVTSEIEEAIFLADRLVIMSNRPATIRKVLEIDLPRPRQFQMLTSKEYLGYKGEALEILHEEAMKAFARGKTSSADFVEAYSKIAGK
ncbi:MAG: ABC transporter ATP-binding protein [Deltaproteobacteria bacterium]|nr:ABC transporter ATP-binding protein [Deltaproteobacteria bacterium]